MTDKEKIRAEIERLIELNEESAENTKFGLGKVRGLQQILSFVNSLPEEPVSENLDSFAIKYAQDKPYPVTVCQAVKAGVKWQKKQMMKKAVEGVVKESYAERLVVESRYIYKDEIDELDIKRGDKVKLIIVRED